MDTLALTEVQETRKLATIRRISEILPHTNADKLEIAVVDGWRVITQKGLYQPGDLAIYCEVDSYLPVLPKYSFLAGNSARKMGDLSGYRLRTIKLRGELSQGLLIPLHQFEDDFGIDWGCPIDFRPNNGQLIPIAGYIVSNVKDSELPEDFEYDEQACMAVEEGDDVTEILGIIKWDPPLPASLGGVAKGNFPGFIPKTDEERIQNCYKWISKKNWETDKSVLDHRWETTIKLDGSSMTTYYRDGVFGVCSRNLDLMETEGNSFWQIARKKNLEVKLAALGRNIAIQGELMGPGIQKNPEKLQETELFVFKIWDIDNSRYLTSNERLSLVVELDLKHAPLIPAPDTSNWTVADFLAFAEGPSLNAAVREGVVFKSLDDPAVSFKAISNKWLLTEE